MNLETRKWGVTVYLRDLKSSLLRRWYLVVVGLILSAGIGFATYQTVPATYQAKASAVLLPPHSSVAPGGNPYLQLGDLSQAMDVLIRRMSSDSFKDTIQTKHPGVTFSVGTDPASSGPVVIVSAEGRTPEAATTTVHDLLGSIPSALEELQSSLSIAGSSQITSMTLVADNHPVTVTKAKLQLGGVVAAGAGTASFLLVGLIDGLLLGRSARRRTSTAERDSRGPAVAVSRRVKADASMSS